MNASQFPFAELDRLISAWCDREMMADERSRLELLLTENSEARRRYLLSMNLESLAERFSRVTAIDALAHSVPSIGQVELPPARRALQAIDFRRHPVRFALASLATVAVFWAFWASLIRFEQDDRLGRSVHGDEEIASVQFTEDCQWASPEQAAAPGNALKTGQVLHLTQGIAEVKLDQGARVVLRGPVKFQVRSANTVFLSHGSLVAQVPQQAIGFTVGTPSARIVDLGTAFGVTVDNQGDTEVHVLKGMVETTGLHSDAERQTLSAGDGIRIRSAPSKAEQIDANAALYESMLAVPKANSLQPEPSSTLIPLGNLFDDRPPVSLVDAIATDTYMAEPDSGHLGIESVFRGGDALRPIEPRLWFDFASAGWTEHSFAWPANDARYADKPLQDKAGIRTQGIAASAQPGKIEDGIGMHANGALTFNLQEIRQAGKLGDHPLRFVCDRAGMTDAVFRYPKAAIHMLVIVSGSHQVLDAYVNGEPVKIEKRADAWRLARVPASPLKADGRFIKFDIPLTPQADFLTLAVVGASDLPDPTDHGDGVWSGARLEVSPQVEVSSE